MMRADALNLHNYGGYTEMNSPSSTVCSTDEDKSKQSIVNKTLSQKYSTDVDKWFSTEKYKSKFTIMEQKDSENEVTYNVPYNFNVSNVIEWKKNSDVS